MKKDQWNAREAGAWERAERAYLLPGERRKQAPQEVDPDKAEVFVRERFYALLRGDSGARRAKLWLQELFGGLAAQELWELWEIFRENEPVQAKRLERELCEESGEFWAYAEGMRRTEEEMKAMTEKTV